MVELIESTPRILIVDDDDRNLRMLEAVLVPLDYKVILARNGAEALEKVRETPPDVILLDIMMPDMDGFEVARRLKNDDETKTIPVVMVTALRDVEDRVKALEAGADDFLAEPVDKTELRAKVNSMLKVKAYNDQMYSEYQRRLRSLASELSLAEECERRRLASDLHDGVSQNMAVIKMKLGALRESLTSNDLTTRLDVIQDLVESTIRDTQALVFDISPPVLYELGLEAAVEWLAEYFRENHGIQCEFEYDSQPKPLGDDIRGFLFRAVRELMINVVKHTQAQTMHISIKREGSELHIAVKDDAPGFDSSHVPWQSHGFGLFSIRERITEFGGHFTFQSQPGEGTQVTLVVPLDSSEDTSRGK